MKFKLLLIGTVLTFACVTIVPATGVVPTLVQVATPTATLNCAIKGNITLDGQKIFHVPGGKFYSTVIINPARGERIFCSEQDAIAAGFRKALEP